MTLWFGRHKGRPLTDVDADDLRWALATVKLSGGVRATLAAEPARQRLAGLATAAAH